MNASKVPITFEPFGLTAWVSPGTTVHEAALVAGVPLSSPCGGRGVCGSCGVRVMEGTLAGPDDVEAARLAQLRPEVRLGCRARVEGRVTVRPVIALTPSTSQAPRLVRHARTAVGVDLGTTSVSAVAVDLDSGVQGPLATTANLQAAAGADVLSRIAAALAGRGDELRRLAARSIFRVVAAATEGVESPPERVVIAGNTAMSSLVVGADVSSLATHPFSVPVLPGIIVLKDGGESELSATVVPSISGFVGGDTLACLVHTGMTESDGPELLVDLGTNAEVALATGGRLWVASAAAGPAFEGLGIESGGVAADGSILKADWSADEGWKLDTLGGAEPRRFAGSGLISALALLRRLGHLDDTGLLTEIGPLAGCFFHREDGVLRLRVGEGEEATLSQLDVRTLQLAKAAVRVAIERVLAAADIRASQLVHLYVAGAFGSGVTGPDVIELGIVPSSAGQAVRSVGNAALFGSLAIAVDPQLLAEARETARRATHVDLAADPEFNDSLMRALGLEPYDA